MTSAASVAPPTVSSIESVTLEVDEATVAASLYRAAFDLGAQLGVRPSEAPTGGFR